MPSDDGHNYTFYGFDGPYWERKKERELRVTLDVDCPEDKIFGLKPEYLEYGFAEVFKDEDEDEDYE